MGRRGLFFERFNVLRFCDIDESIRNPTLEIKRPVCIPKEECVDKSSSTSMRIG